jgi:hypothetical protein
MEMKRFLREILWITWDKGKERLKMEMYGERGYGNKMY